jgi:hypothetical protein
MTVKERLAQIIEAMPEDRAGKLLSYAENLAQPTEGAVSVEAILRNRRELTPEEFSARLRALSHSTGAPPLSDEAVSRESMYY